MTNWRLGRFASLRSGSLAPLHWRKTSLLFFFTAETQRTQRNTKGLFGFLGGLGVSAVNRSPLEDYHEPFSYRAVFALDV
jgi:hypothetical protein